MCAAMSGEISADVLEAYRRASLAVYDALDHCELHRAQARERGQNAWTLPHSTQAELLCTWNAFVLQTLGDSLLAADYRNSEDTVGFVPPVTADQILRFYTQVEGWLTRAEQAHHNPDYQLDMDVPAELPGWSEIEPCPDAHLFGIMEAMRAIRDHCEGAMLFLRQSPPQENEHEKHFNAVQQLHAAARTKARYADDMIGDNLSRDVHERVEAIAKTAIEHYYLLGQLIAMPQHAVASLAPPKIEAPKLQPSKIELLEAQTSNVETPAIKALPPQKTEIPLASSKFELPQLIGSSNPPRIVPQPILGLPGQPNFDAWCLTDPDTLPRWKSDPAARNAITTMWRLDPNPRRTLEIQAEIDDAFARGHIAYALDHYGKKLGHFFCCPWSPVYTALRSITIGDRRLHAMESFIYNVSCEGVNIGESFKREIMVAAFRPTTRREYGDPNEAADH